jgi:hypothetical protein
MHAQHTAPRTSMEHQSCEFFEEGEEGSGKRYKIISRRDRGRAAFTDARRCMQIHARIALFAMSGYKQATGNLRRL